MAVLFLFGAGASFGSGPCSPSNPPLGKDLLIRMREKSGVASTIDGALLESFIADPEQGMINFFNERNCETTHLLKQMCAYLAQFRVEKENTYIKLFNLLKKRKNICMATTNYDLLIEQAICSVGCLVQYHSSKRNRNNIPVLKIHGSVNFIPVANIVNIDFELPDCENSAIFDGPIDIYNDEQDVIAYCESDSALSPAVALYHPKKSVLHCPSFVKYQQEEFRSEVERSSKIFIIGLKINPNDEHIWSEIEKTSADVYIVDKDKESTITWVNSLSKKNIYHIADTFDESIVRIKNILQL
ncbi:hypothetical protein ACIL8P_13060 [Escherichia coli]|uniref:hypothetical protein n=1 Tax=Escherichia coli TaxID=562 RepID=UPI0039BD1F96